VSIDTRMSSCSCYMPPHVLGAKGCMYETKAVDLNQHVLRRLTDIERRLAALENPPKLNLSRIVE
jgi:hypothetical protein